MKVKDNETGSACARSMRRFGTNEESADLSLPGNSH